MGFFPFITYGQGILDQVSCIDIRTGFPLYSWMVKDPQGGYIVSVQKDKTGTEGLFIDDVLVTSFHHMDDQFSASLNDIFICKLNSDFGFESALVVDNAEIGRDIFCGDSYVLYSMSIIETSADRDSFPILLNGSVEIPREGNQGKGVLIVMNKELDHVSYFFPSTGDIGQVAVDGNMAYIEMLIPDLVPFIIVNEVDTIHHQHFAQDSNLFGLQTVVLCKYNLLNNQIAWTLRIGDVGREKLNEMLIDGDHNLVILGETNSRYFPLNGVDTVLNNSDHCPFIAKYSPEGEFLSGHINTSPENANTYSMLVDNEDNIFISGVYYGPDFAIEDTILIRPGIDFPNHAQGTITKFNPDCGFEWIMQAEGNFERTGFWDVAELSDDRIILSGDFRGGFMEVQEQVYIDDPLEEKNFGFMLMLDKKTGMVMDHIMTIGDFRRDFYDIEVDNDGNLDLFMRYRGVDTIFGQLFENPISSLNGYLIKLDLSPVANEVLPEESSSLSIFPNPVSGDGITLSINGGWTTQTITYAIYDMMGHLVEKNSNSSDTNPFISTSNWPPGPYWLQAQIGDQRLSHLMIVH